MLSCEIITLTCNLVIIMLICGINMLTEHEQFSIKDKYMTILTQYQNPRSVKEGMPMRWAWLLCIIICCNNHYLFEAKLMVAYAYLCPFCACYYSIKYLDMQDKYMYVDIQDSYVNMQHMLTYVDVDMQEICNSMRIIKI